MKNEIIIFENQNVKLEVNMKDETVWLTQQQMAELFGRDTGVISRHIKNVFEEEIDEKSNLQKMQFPNSDKPVNMYSLDVIISVGYRVKSKNGIAFRKWANKILKDYMLKGYAVNERRLEYLEKSIKLIDIANRGSERITTLEEAKDIIKIINNYTKALNLLDDYDHRTLKKSKGSIAKEQISYQDCLDIISKLKFNESSNNFALERDNGLKSIINDIYQTFGGVDVYSSIEEKAANFLYMIVKNHVFIDGNKRIAATLFIYFLQFNNILYRDSVPIIDNNTLAALTLLIAESNPKEKEIIIDLVINFLI